MTKTHTTTIRLSAPSAAALDAAAVSLGVARNALINSLGEGASRNPHEAATLMGQIVALPHAQGGGDPQAVITVPMRYAAMFLMIREQLATAPPEE